MLCAQPQGAIFAVNEGFEGHVRVFLHFFAIGVQLLNFRIPLSDFFRHTSIFYKKSQVLCLLPPGFAAIRINFIAASKEERTVPRRKPLDSAFFLFVIQVFLSSNQAAQTVKTAVQPAAAAMRQPNR